MTLTFLSHRRKSIWRSKSTGKSIALRIVMGLLIAYFLVNFLVLAYFLDKVLAKVYPNQDVVESFNGLVLYYFLVDLFMRFQLQELPTVMIKPYLHLKVKKRQIVNYLSLSSLATFFNLWSLVFVLPFILKVILPRYGSAAFWGMLIAVVGLTLFNNYFIQWVKRKVSVNTSWMVGMLAVILLLWGLESYFRLFSVSDWSVAIFAKIIAQPAYAGICVLLAAIIYFVNRQYLKNNLYLEELQKSGSESKSVTEIPFLDRFGRTGDLAANELKLILRNKRPRAVLMLSVMFMFYGLIFYTQEIYQGYGWIIFCGLFMTGIFIINYGQLMFGWQSAHFDGLLVHKISIKDFFASKFLLFTFFSTVCFILTIPYVYFGWHVLVVHFIMFVWNLGVNAVLVLYFANRNYKRIDLTKGGAFNWEGIGASQWILSIPLMIGPFIIYWPFAYMGYPKVGLALLGITGITFIVTREFWIRKLVSNFEGKRYTIAEGFRNK